MGATFSKSFSLISQDTPSTPHNYIGTISAKLPPTAVCTEEGPDHYPTPSVAVDCLLWSNDIRTAAGTIIKAGKESGSGI